MSNIDNFRITRHQLEYDENNIPTRQYLNNDPGNPGPDRPSWEDLSLHNEYVGYRDMVWTPIDLPYLDIDLARIARIHNDQQKQKDFYETENVGTLMFLKSNNCGTPGSSPEWFDWARDEFPDLIEYVEALPFKSIHQIFFVQTPTPIPPHYDEEKLLEGLLQAQAPSHLHFRWSNVTHWRNEHFYMSKDSGATRIFPMLPPETNAFAYDGATFEHGVDKGFSFTDRAQLVIHGVYDLPLWHELLEKSYQRYKEYAITTSHFN